MTATVIPESFYLKQIHEEWTRNLAQVIAEAWSRVNPGPLPLPYRINSDNWSDTKTIDVDFNIATKPNQWAADIWRHAFSVRFDKLGYDASASKMVRGPERSVENPHSVALKSFTFDLTQDDHDEKFDHSESLTLTNERSTATKNTIKMDVTAENTFTVGGDAYGVKLEDSLKLGFGWSNTDERDAAEKAGENQTETWSVSVTLTAGKVNRVTAESTEDNTSQDFTFNGVHTFSPTITIGPALWVQGGEQFLQEWYYRAGWWASSSPNWPDVDSASLKPSDQAATLTFEAPSGVQTALGGYDPAWPGWRKEGVGWLDVHGANDSTLPQNVRDGFAAALAALTDPAKRTVALSGTINKTAQKGIKTVIAKSASDPGLPTHPNSTLRRAA